MPHHINKHLQGTKDHIVRAIILPQKVLTLLRLAGADCTLDGIDLPLRMLAPSLSFHSGYGPDMEMVEERVVECRGVVGRRRFRAFRTLFPQVAGAVITLCRGDGFAQGTVGEAAGEGSGE